MFASTQVLEFVQGQSRDVPDRKLVLNIRSTVCKFFFIFYFSAEASVLVTMVTVTEERVVGHTMDGGSTEQTRDIRDGGNELSSPTTNTTPIADPSGKALHNFRSMADLIRNKEIPPPVEPDLDSMSPLKEGRSDENENSVQDLRVNGHHHNSSTVKASSHLASMANMREEHLRRWYSGDLGMRNSDSYNIDVDGESSHSDIPSDMSSDGLGGDRANRHGETITRDDDFEEVQEKEDAHEGDVHERSMLDSSELAREDVDENQSMVHPEGDDAMETYEFNNNKSSDFDNMSDIDVDVRKSKRKQFTPKQRGDDMFQHCIISPNADESPAKVRRVGENSLQMQVSLMQQQLRDMQERFFLSREMDAGMNFSGRDGGPFHFSPVENDHLHLHSSRQHSQKSPLGPLGVRVDLNSKHFESKSCVNATSGSSSKCTIPNTQQSSPVHGDTPKDLANLAKLLKDELTQQVGTLVDTVVTKIANSKKSKPSTATEEASVGNTISAKDNKKNVEVKDKPSVHLDSSNSENLPGNKNSSNTANNSSSSIQQSPHEKPHLFSPRIPQHPDHYNNHRGSSDANFMERIKFPGFPFTSVTKPKIECEKNDKLEVPRPHKPKINDKLMNPYFDPARSFADFSRHAPWFPPLPFPHYGQVSAPPHLHAAFGAQALMKDQEQTEALPLVVSSPKKKRTKVTDTRLSPRAARALLQEPVPAEQPLQGAAPGMGVFDTIRKDQMPAVSSSFHSPLMPVSLPTSVAIPNPSLQHSDVFGMYHHQQHHHQQKDTGFPGLSGSATCNRELHNSRGSPVRDDSSPSMSYTPSESPSLFKNDMMEARFNDDCTNIDGYPMISFLQVYLKNRINWFI